jgi:rhodanese-related sulfurtransferase
VKLIGLTGLRRSGKDTAAQVLVEDGFENIKFAGALKEMLRTYLAYVGVDGGRVESYIEGPEKEFATSLFEGKTTRYAMQTLGTEWGRELIGTNIWVNAAIARAKQFDKVVVSDVRFPNEAVAIKAAGGTIIRISRPGQVADSHPSESLIQSIQHDLLIANIGTIQDLHTSVRQYANLI